MIKPQSVSVVIPTRGDHDLSPILSTLGDFHEVIVLESDSVHGRYVGMEEAERDILLTQDDDCIVPHWMLLSAYEGGILVNVPTDEKRLLGWGAVLERGLAQEALAAYLRAYPADDLFRRCCDVIVTTLNDCQRIDLGHEDLPWATAPDRMYHQPNHYREREEVERRCLALLS